MFADGAASTQWDFGRYSSKVLRQQPFVTTDVVFRQGVVGLLATSPSGRLRDRLGGRGVRDVDGFKVENGAISITPDGASPRTVMEAAKAAGKRIGLVTTATVYDATPAAFCLAHRLAPRLTGAGGSAARARTRRPDGRWRRLLPAGERSRRQAKGWPGRHRRISRQGAHGGREHPRELAAASGAQAARACSPTTTWISRSIAIPPGSPPPPRWPPPP